MKSKQPKYHRRIIRLQEYDYSRAGAYFVTVCAGDRMSLFGDITNGKIVLNEYGRVVRDEWARSSQIRTEIELDEFVIMPNHLHGIAYIVDNANGATGRSPLPAPYGPKSRTLGSFIAGFKSVVTKRINGIRNTSGKSIWQRNYYEHVIRDEKSLNRIREYIVSNPLRWELDRENPRRTGTDEFDRWLATFKKRPDAK